MYRTQIGLDIKNFEIAMSRLALELLTAIRRTHVNRCSEHEI